MNGRKYQQACEHGFAMIGVVVELAFELERIGDEHPGIVDAEFLKRNKGLSTSVAKLARMVTKDARELRAAYIDGGLGAKKYESFTRREFERACGLRPNAK